MSKPYQLAAPPMWAVDLALTQAQLSPCAKSKRGAVAFVHENDGVEMSRRELRGLGHNGPALGTCDGSDACKASCGKRCVHAEMRAVREAGRGRGGDIVHVKVDERGELVAGGGPSCWQCSREILDAGYQGVWLYEKATGFDCWRYYTAADFHRTTMLACDIYNPEAPASAPTPTRRCSGCKQVFSPEAMPSRDGLPRTGAQTCAPCAGTRPITRGSRHRAEP